MTKANIIVHHLIGESLANSLDEVVEATVEESARQMASQDNVYGSEKFKEYVETRESKGWGQVWKQWSAMTSSLAIDLSFDKRRDAWKTRRLPTKLP